jgi:RNA polymerase sigma-70 factor (ECF subfamily)
MDLEAELARALQGDREALGVLLFHYQPRLLGLIRSRLPASVREHAEDVRQDTFCNVSRALAAQTFASVEEFQAWLMTVARHACVDHVRHHLAQCRGRDRTVPLDGQVPDNRDGPDRAARRADRSRRLNEAMQTLGPDDRALTQLRYFEGLTFREVGEHFGRNGVWALREWNRIRQVLRDRLGDAAGILPSSR